MEVGGPREEQLAVINCISSSRDGALWHFPHSWWCCHCLGEHTVKIPWVQLPAIDRIAQSTSSSVACVLWTLGRVMLQMWMCISWQLLHAEKKEDSTVTRRNPERIFFMQENKSSRTVCSLKWKKMGNISQPEEAFKQSGVCSKLGLPYVEGLNT